MEPKLEATIIKDTINDVTVLRLNYPLGFSMSKETNEVGRKLVEAYRSVEHTNPSCVIVIDAEFASAFVDRALFELYKTVVIKNGGRLLCVSYPKDYFAGLEAQGITSLKGFSTFDSLEEALQTL